MYKFLGKILDFVTPATDKLKHNYQWTLLFLVTLYGFSFLENYFNIINPTIYAYVITIVTAAYKEIVHDKLQKKGTPEKLDFFFSVLNPTLFMIYIHFVI